MKSRLPRLLRAAFVALLFGGALNLASSSFGQLLPPAGDLTVTVNELANGSVQFSLSGTANLQNNVSSMTILNFRPGDPSTALPPNADYGVFPLPEGLKLTMTTESVFTSAPEGPEEAFVGPMVTEYPLNNVYFSGGWYLGYFSSGTYYLGDTIAGSGTVVTGDVPFSLFIPGTFVVTPSTADSEPEEGAAAPSTDGIYPYLVTYKVIPYSIGLDVDKPKRFPTTQVNRSSRTQRLKITNLGSLPVAGLRVINSNSSDFSVSDPKSSSLDPGESTTFTATFTPKRSGKRSSRVTITDGTSTSRIRLRGKAIAVATNSPRFPHPSN